MRESQTPTQLKEVRTRAKLRKMSWPQTEIEPTYMYRSKASFGDYSTHRSL